MKEKVGIVGYGVSIPYARIKTEEIARAWEKPFNPGDSLLVKEKAVPNFDEDAVTLSVEAATNAITRAKIKADEIGAVFVGSESHPYAVKPSGTTERRARQANSTHPGVLRARASLELGRSEEIA